MIKDFKLLNLYGLLTLDIQETSKRELGFSEVVTWNDDEHLVDSIANLTELQESLVDLGINFTYRIEQHHDRFIAADNGWKISLGLGLDIFEKIEGRFNVAGIDQTKRKCKACELTYLKI
jgi:ATP-dependent Lon protease